MRALGARSGCLRALRLAVPWSWLLASAAACGHATDIPRLVGDQTRVECRDALTLAQAAFAGRALTLDFSTSNPPALQSRFAIAEKDADDETSEPLFADAGNFERVEQRLDPADATTTVLIWQRGTPGSKRWVVTHHETGWRGTYFGLYDVPVALGQDDFLSLVRRGTPAPESGTVTILEGWQAPVVLRTPGDAALWVIDTGAPWRPLGAWKVFAQGSDDPVSPCAVSFGLDENQHPTALLPPEIARLDAMLLDALGPGVGEGTLHPTERIKTDVQRTWANIALRPWSLPQPYNSREEVEGGLKDWAAQDASQKVELARIHALYPRAESALAAYYHAQFRLSGEQARRCAAHALDVALRMYFAFHSERAKAAESEAPEPNPWPEGAMPKPPPSVHPG